MSTSPTLNDVVQVIRNSVNLHHLEESRFSPETSLREGGLELDSVDILEVIVAIEHKFGVKVDDAEMGKKYFRTIGTITDLVQSRQGPTTGTAQNQNA